MKAAIYARYSSDNQRPDSIDDQIAACRRYAATHNIEVLDDHIYTDASKSGSDRDRTGIAALQEAARDGIFDTLLVDDFQRIARDSLFFFRFLSQMDYHDVRVISISTGMDTSHEGMRMAIQFTGVVSEAQLATLRANTLRGQREKRERGSFVGEATYGFKSIPRGVITIDKSGRPRPESQGMSVVPAEAVVVLDIFDRYVAGESMGAITKDLNARNVPRRRGQDGAWTVSTVYRILGNEKYVGRWAWNKTGSKRDPLTNRRRTKRKPESEWIVLVDEALRIVPQATWDAAQKRHAERTKTWPGKKSKGCFSPGHGSREEQHATHLFSASLVCGLCGGAIVLVDGTRGGHYGCGARIRGVCTNKTTILRRQLERMMLDQLREQVVRPDAVQKVLKRVASQLKSAREEPEQLKLKETDLDNERRRLANFIEYIASGKAVQSITDAVQATEARVVVLEEEVARLRGRESRELRVPPLEWIKDRLASLGDLLGRNVALGAQELRKIFGRITLEPRMPDVGRAYYVARTSLGVLDLLEVGGAAVRRRQGRGGRLGDGTNNSGGSNSGGGSARTDPEEEEDMRTTETRIPRERGTDAQDSRADSGSDVFLQWRRRESNPGPKAVAKDLFTCVASGFDLGSGHAHWQAIPSPSRCVSWSRRDTRDHQLVCPRVQATRAPRLHTSSVLRRRGPYGRSCYRWQLCFPRSF